VFIIKAIVVGGFHMNVAAFYSVQMKSFLLELSDLHNAMDISKGVHMFV